MTRLVPIKPEHYPRLYEIAMIAEPFQSDMSFMQFAFAIGQREGWCIDADYSIVGSVTFGEFMPLIDATLHIFVHPDWHGRWINRTVLREGFSLPFKLWRLPRISGFSVDGLTDYSGEILKKVGFVEEGVKRNGCRVGATYHDVRLYGMLKEECKWL